MNLTQQDWRLRSARISLLLAHDAIANPTMDQQLGNGKIVTDRRCEL